MLISHELTAERRALLKTRAIDAVIDQNPEFEVRAAVELMARLHGRMEGARDSVITPVQIYSPESVVSSCPPPTEPRRRAGVRPRKAAQPIWRRCAIAGSAAAWNVRSANDGRHIDCCSVFRRARRRLGDRERVDAVVERHGHGARSVTASTNAAHSAE